MRTNIHIKKPQHCHSHNLKDPKIETRNIKNPQHAQINILLNLNIHTTASLKKHKNAHITNKYTHIHTLKTHIYIQHHITKPTTTHKHTLQKPNVLTRTLYKTATDTKPNIIKRKPTQNHRLYNHIKKHGPTHGHFTKAKHTHKHLLENPIINKITLYKRHTNKHTLVNTNLHTNPI